MDKAKLKNVVEAILVASDRILNLNQIEKMLTAKADTNKTETVVKDPVTEAANSAANDEPIAEAVEETTEMEASAADSEESSEPAAEMDADTEESISLKRAIKEVIATLQEEYAERSMELKEVASGYRIQVRQEYAEHVGKLWEERPAKYSRALLETLVLIAYRQPITRGEIEAIRGVSVSSHIIKTLVEREWVRVIGHRDVPGKPAILGSTKEFLDYFNLKSLDELPSLAEIKDLDKIAPELALSEKPDASDSAATEMVEADPESIRKTAQTRRQRRVRRMQLKQSQNAQSDDDNGAETAASQEIEQEQAEIS